MATTVSFTHASTAPRGRTGRIALWILQIALAAMFLMAGGSKLVGAPAMIALFNDIGVGQWFRYATGLIEVGSAFALLRPRLAVFGAVALVPTMVGAILAQLFVVHSSPVPPTVLLAGAALVLWARRHELPIPKQSAR